jgi:hypothetical protein
MSRTHPEPGYFGSSSERDLQWDEAADRSVRRRAIALDCNGELPRVPVTAADTDTDADAEPPC